MMLAFSRYSLLPPKNISRKPREGALIRVLIPQGTFGYADCHPWTEFGDLSIENQLNFLRENKTTSLIEQTLKFAVCDAKARFFKKNVFQDLVIPRSHAHIFDSSIVSEELLNQFSQDGFSLVKVKMGSDLTKDCELIHRWAKTLRSSRLKLRLDFNSKLNLSQFLDFLNNCAQQLDVIDFFEDPFLYDPLIWEEIRKKKNIKLACDNQSLRAIDFPNSCDYLVVKPAIQEASLFLTNKIGQRQLVFTSYLDHPIGQFTAAYAAATIYKKNPEIVSECGFLTHHAYSKTPFNAYFKQAGPQLAPFQNGDGWGFETPLKELEWKTLS